MSSSPENSRGAPALTVLGAVASAAVLLALYLVFFVAREAVDTMGGQLQRIFYFHVPSAWIAYLAFTIVFVASIAHLKTGARRWDLIAHSSAEIGVVFCALVLITGPIWARPVWGTWWVWDARLTSTLILFCTYAGYLLFRNLATEEARIGRLAAVIGIIGFIDVPIVHFSVQWWRTQHPSGPTVANPVADSGLGGPELAAFFTSLVAFTLLFVWLLGLRTRLGHLRDEVEAIELDAAMERSPRRSRASPEAGDEPAGEQGVRQDAAGEGEQRLPSGSR